MKKAIWLVATVMIVLIVGVGLTFAVPTGKTLVFKKSPMGAVTFSGDTHAKAGFKCNDCHTPGIFQQMKFGAVNISMSQIYAGKLCGSCHNGTKAFKAQGNCNRCHKR